MNPQDWTEPSSAAPLGSRALAAALANISPQVADSLEELDNPSSHRMYEIEVGYASSVDPQFLRRISITTGYYPVVIGEDLDLDELDSPTEILEIAERVDGAAWLREQPGYEPPTTGVLIAPPAPSTATNTLAEDGSEYPERLLLVPTEHAYQIPAYLQFGGFNECPGPVEHVAVLRYWSKSHDLRISEIGKDNITLLIEHPIADHRIALQRAAEHRAYCGELQAEARADHLMTTRTWYFWWD